MSAGLFDLPEVEVSVERWATVDGERVPLSKCDWLLIAPCGCAAGVHVAVCGDDAITTEQEARIRFTGTETAKEAERDKARGWVVRLITHEAFKAMPFGDCGHDPKWGEPKVEREGYKWAVKSGFRRQTYQHLAPVAAIYPTSEERRDGAQFTAEYANALCGAGGTVGAGWYVDWNKVDATMRCSRCEKLAAS